MSALDRRQADVSSTRPTPDPDRMACLLRLGDAISAVDAKLGALDDDDRSSFPQLAREFDALKTEATTIAAWDLAEIALAGERVFSSDAVRARGLTSGQRAFFENVRVVLEEVASDPNDLHHIDMDVIGDAFDRLLDELGVD